MTNEETLKSLTAKIKKVIPDKDASFMGEEFEYKFTLEDVLMALGESLIPMGDYVIDNGYLSFYKIESDEPEVEWSWKLNTPLHLQCPDTIKYLDEIIK